MQYLGEFLSPTNSIAQDQDKLTKYFYFRPDKYDNPDADLQNIFIIKNMAQFPKRKDKLAENELYAVESIEVNKRLSDEESGVVNVSYVVTATYDLLSNIQKREDSGSSGGSSSSSSSSSDVDDDGNEVTSSTPPWKLRAKISWQPIAVNIAFTKAYNNYGLLTLDVVNSAGNRIIAETQRYQIEITFQKSYQTNQSFFDSIYTPHTNDSGVSFTNVFPFRTFPADTLLILPPSCSVDYWQTTDKNGNKIFQKYYTYTVKIIYDSTNWLKKLLNVGNRAKFTSNGQSETIYQLTVSDENGELKLPPTFTNAAGVLNWRAKNRNSQYSIQAEIVNQPLPLTATGSIYMDAVKDPVNYPYLTITYRQYPTLDFSLLPL